MSSDVGNSRGNFIQDIINADLAAGLNGGRVHTRFPPEPNGWLHIGHAVAICLNHGLATAHGGKFNLRFDDTNPLKEEQEFVDAIIADVKWLGADWEDRLFFASDYFAMKYNFAVDLINKGLAYVDDLSAEEIRDRRGTLTEPGQDSPFRTRTIAENLDMFARMKQGEFADGTRVLRAKIDMGSPNINMRDPVLYRIRHAHHHRTGNEWCIYPMYDYSHPIGDALEGITHSICTLEYADHRPLYDWVVDNIGPCSPQPGRPKQIEFGRVGVSHTVMSKRKLRRLVDEGFVDGWDDPRMPTIAGMRRRGYTPSSLRTFADKCGVGRKNMTAELALLEHCIREELNEEATRVMAVLRPLKITLQNYPADQVEWLTIENNPENPFAGTRQVPFSRELCIEQEDFMEVPTKKFHRLSPGGEVRLKGAYIIKCVQVIKDAATGEVSELICTYDPETKSGGAASSRKVKGTSHWVSAAHAEPIEVRLYDTLFGCENPEAVNLGAEFTVNINPQSLVTLSESVVEPYVNQVAPGERMQFLRQGYFILDPLASGGGRRVFNRIVGLKDSFIKGQQGHKSPVVE
ncbi:MAG: glutamine--tRNA ligase/YqeY domain fusion protein [Peptococcaceae bacterium]|nr:glutamine--tRNA ligase/YqeY domain fusion protein [Peptococcaceae bacterium]